MYQVDAERYIQLKSLVQQSDSADEIIRLILNGSVKSIFVDRPYNPEALLLVKEDDTHHLVGESSDIRFIRGIEQYSIERKQTTNG